MSNEAEKQNIIQFTQHSLRAEMDQVLKYEVAQRHSYFQLQYFLIGKEPTLQAKMWQCLRELKIRRESMESLDLEMESTKDRIELLDIGIERIIVDRAENATPRTPLSESLYQRECEINIRQIERQKKAAEASLVQLAERRHWVEDECRFFLETFKNLVKVEKLKPFDDLASQKQYWSERLAQKLNLKMLTHNQLDTELVETIVSLPDDMPIKQQALTTLNLRHVNMVRQLKETMQHIEETKAEEPKEN